MNPSVNRSEKNPCHGHGFLHYAQTKYRRADSNRNISTMKKISPAEEVAWQAELTRRWLQRSGQASGRSSGNTSPDWTKEQPTRTAITAPERSTISHIGWQTAKQQTHTDRDCLAPPNPHWALQRPNLWRWYRCPNLFRSVNPYYHHHHHNTSRGNLKKSKTQESVKILKKCN